MFTISVKPVSKPTGNILANVRVVSGVLSMECTLEFKKDGTYALYGPSRFVESLKSDDNTGFIHLGKVVKDYYTAVLNSAVEKYESIRGIPQVQKQD